MSITELRLCSISGAQWLDALATNPGAKVPRPPAGLGPMVEWMVAQRLRVVSTTAELLASGAMGVVVAPKGISFDPGHITSAVHAVACAAIVDNIGEASHANAIEAFFNGQFESSNLPNCMREAGVISCMKTSVAQRIGEWIARVNRETLIAEIKDMHGAAVVKDSLAAIDDLHGTFTVATRIHEVDVCCWRPLSM